MQDHKAIVRRFYEIIWNRDDRSIIPELLHEDFTMRGSLGLVKAGHAGFSNYIDFIRNALDKYHCEIVDMVEEGNKLYARIVYSGIHKGELFGYAPTYARLQWDGIAAFTFSDGKISDIWVLGDVHGVRMQLARYVSD